MNNETINISIDGCSYDISFRYRSLSQDLIVLLHGLGCSKVSFEDVWYHKDLTGLSILAFDLLGFGRSEKPTDFSYSLEDHARVCEAVIRKFPEHRLHLVAHSMGGAIGLLLSGDILDSAISFINVEGNLISEDCGFISRKTNSVSYDVFANKLFPDFRYRFQNEEHQNFSLEMATPLAIYKSSKALVAWSDSGHLLERFKDLKCNKAYFYGEQNSGMKVLNKLGHIEKRRITRSGHFLMNDNPEEFYSELFNFLSLLS
jgi:pimeloyl-ACP methyl ester carboxylesterase